MRTHAALLLFEDIFDFVPTGNANIANLARDIFTPNILIAEADCGTTLGRFEPVNYELEGLVELATDLRFDPARIQQLLADNIFETATRHTSTCISKGGLCQKCYAATYPDQPVPNVLDRVNVQPEYRLETELIEINEGKTIYALPNAPEGFDKTYIYTNGTRLQDGVDYSIADNTLTLNYSPEDDLIATIHYISRDKKPFLVWLANTYAGSLLGMKALPTQPLPVRSLFLSSSILENRLQLIGEDIKQNPNIPPDYSNYSDSIKDPLERALFMIALFTIYTDGNS